MPVSAVITRPERSATSVPLALQLTSLVSLELAAVLYASDLSAPLYRDPAGLLGMAEQGLSRIGLEGARESAARLAGVHRLAYYRFDKAETTARRRAGFTNARRLDGCWGHAVALRHMLAEHANPLPIHENPIPVLGVTCPKCGGAGELYALRPIDVDADENAWSWAPCFVCLGGAA